MKTQTYTRIICVVVCLVSSCVSQVQSQEQATRSGPGSFVAIQGTKLYYEECGSASQTVVLIHDGVVNSSVWDDVWPEFCRHFHTVRYDRRGYGRSTAATTWYSETDDLAALLRQLKIRHAALVGSSHGGELSIDFTLAHPEVVQQLVLVGAVVSGMPYSKHFLDREGTNSKQAFELLDKGDVKAAISEWSKDKYLIAPDNDAARKRLFSLLSANPQDMSHKDYPLPTKPALPRLHEIHVPTLLVTGDADIPDVHVHAGAIEAGIPNAHRTIIKGVGHLMYLEKPADFSRQVISFIEQNTGSPDAFDADVVKDWHTAKLFTLAVAEAMPADKYDFKLVPDVRSFGEIMVHIAASQAERFAQITGTKPPLDVEERSQELDKASALKLLAQSFDFCIAQLDSLTPVQLKRNYSVDWYERPEVSGREMVTAMFVHTAHHRAQAEVYLRANGITPPVYRF